jgi:hypothetical protein
MKKMLLAFASGILGAPLLYAMSIGVGLQWKDVFVQEYWQGGKAYYAIANFREEPVTITVSGWQAEDAPQPQVVRKEIQVQGNNVVRVEIGAQVTVAGTVQAGPAKVEKGTSAGPWQIPAKSVMRVEAPQAEAGKLLSFQVSGKSLGLLSAPQAGETQAAGKCLTYDGLNGSGGRHTNLWCEQDAPTVKSGGVIELKLQIPARSGTLTFKKEAGDPTPNIAIGKVLIREASSETAEVVSDGKTVTIDTGKMKKDVPVHTVTLRFDAPKVDKPAMVYIDGWLAIIPGKSGHGITRGVIVEP